MLARPKRTSVHREPGLGTSGTMRTNGYDTLDRHTAAQVRPQLRRLAAATTRKLTDEQVADQARYFALAEKYEAARAA